MGARWPRVISSSVIFLALVFDLIWSAYDAAMYVKPPGDTHGAVETFFWILLNAFGFRLFLVLPVAAAICVVIYLVSWAIDKAREMHTRTNRLP